MTELTREKRLAQDNAGNAPILFYGPKNPYGEFSNFSLHGLWLPNPWTGDPTYYPTGEHRYQAMKSSEASGHDYVLAASGPGDAKTRGRRVFLREGWGAKYGGFAWYAMYETIIAKAYFHASIRKLLASTGERHIYEDSPIDDIWGWRYRDDHRGENLLGKCWMAVRALHMAEVRPIPRSPAKLLVTDDDRVYCRACYDDEYGSETTIHPLGSEVYCEIEDKGNQPCTSCFYDYREDPDQ